MAQHQQMFAEDEDHSSFVSSLDDSLLHALGGHGAGAYRSTEDEQIAALWNRFGFLALVAGFLTAVSVIFG